MTKKQLTLIVAGNFPVVDIINFRRYEQGEELTKVEINSWVRSQYAAGTFKDAPDAEKANADALASYDAEVADEAAAEVTVLKPPTKVVAK